MKLVFQIDTLHLQVKGYSILAMSDQLVSVIIPSYNHEAFVQQAIESVMKQTYKKIELIVIDDGSKDNSSIILKKLQAQYSFKLVVRENRGLCKTLNEGFSLANGKWVALLASDDFYHERFIEKNVASVEQENTLFIASHCEASMISVEGDNLGERNATLGKPPLEGDAFHEIAHVRGGIVPSSLFTSKAVMEKVGGYDEELIAEDFDLHLRVARIAKFKYISAPLFYSRHVPGSLGRKPWLWADDIFAALAKHADILGDELDTLVVEHSLRLSKGCFLHGGWRYGSRLGLQAIMKADSLSGRLRVSAQFISNSSYALCSHIAHRVLPKEMINRIRLVIR
jgi:alpha-1,3-rhamnosyltransferase